MRCTHCNGEHPDNFKFCPETGKKIMPQFKTCGNEDCPDSGKYILPLEAKFCPRCGRPLGVQNEQKRENTADKDCSKKIKSSETVIGLIFCPECGSVHFEDDGSGHIQYTCNNCGHIWGDDEDEDEKKDEDNQDEELYQIGQFFPVSGIVLEQSTVEDAERQSYRYSKIEYLDSGLVIAWDNGIQIRKEAKSNLFTDIYLTSGDEMPKIWEIRGFKWDLSYEQWIELFKKLNFKVVQTKSPRISSWEDRKRPNYFDADFVAIAKDNSIKFQLNFSYGEKGTRANSKSTLYSIKACSPSYDAGYTNGIGMRIDFDNLEHIYECTLGPSKEI